MESACALEAKVAVHRGTPKLHVDGEVVAPLIFYNNVTHPVASTVEIGWREIRYAVAAGYDIHGTGSSWPFTPVRRGRKPSSFRNQAW
jgi:hypothetical protein